MIQQLTSLNPLQVPSWNWLAINSTSLAVPETSRVYAGNPLSAELPDGAKLEDVQGIPDVSAPYIVEESARYVQQNSTHSYYLVIDRGAEVSEPIYLDYRLGAGERLINRMHIVAHEGSQATVIIRYSAEQGTSVFRAGYLSADVEADARLNVIQIQALPSNAVNLDSVASKVKGEGVFDLMLAELGSQHTVAGCDVALTEDRAHAEVSSLYLAGGTAERDLNYRIEFARSETTGEIVSRGALNGSARKVMRSTIDFLSGASGSEGREEESVLVLSDGVINISSPLLLCGEDDVKGEHATSIGKPDAEKLYYLMTRGFSERQARILLVEAAFTPILDKLPDQELRHEVLQMLREVASL